MRLLVRDTSSQHDSFNMAVSPESVNLDTTVPTVILTGRDVLQQSALGIIRSLGRLGVPVYATIQGRFGPIACSRYLTRRFRVDQEMEGYSSALEQLEGIARQLARPAVLIPTNDIAAQFIASASDTLGQSFLFPKPPKDLPRRLCNKRELYFLCRNIGVPCPEAAFPTCAESVTAFLEGAQLPVVMKIAEPHRRPKGVASVSIVETPTELMKLYRQAEAVGCSDLIFQEYIPEASGEDWIVHAYVNPSTGCSVVFTGRKLRSYPPFAGSTTLGISLRNDALRRQAERLLGSISYAGIVDLDYRLDKRTGEYKLLDFNPRIGANFRMFQDEAGVDVVRAMHLDLTAKEVQRLPAVEGRTFIVDVHDLLASAGYLRSGALTVPAWWRSLKGQREFAWFSLDDPAPFVAMLFRLFWRKVERLFESCQRFISQARSGSHTGSRLLEECDKAPLMASDSPREVASVEADFN